MEFLSEFAQITDNEGTLLDRFRALMFRYWIYMQAAVISTRSYGDGMDLIDRLRGLLARFQGDLSPPEFVQIDQALIEFEFELLDKMDAWYDYVALYDQHRQTQYLRSYPPWKAGKWVEELTVNSDEQGKQLHFYYARIRERYEVISRKLARAKTRGSMRGLLHKKKSDLSEEEIRERLDRILYAAEHGLQVFY